jgi:ionotropic glutamate receptor NMDA 1
MLSLSILSMHENGIMDDLDNEWISLNNTSCQVDDLFPSTLRLSNMADVFMLVAGGVIAGIFLIYGEVTYGKREFKKLRKRELLKKVIANWREMVEEVINIF